MCDAKLGFDDNAEFRQSEYVMRYVVLSVTIRVLVSTFFPSDIVAVISASIRILVLLHLPSSTCHFLPCPPHTALTDAFFQSTVQYALSSSLPCSSFHFSHCNLFHPFYLLLHHYPHHSTFYSITILTTHHSHDRRCVPAQRPHTRRLKRGRSR